MLAHNAISKLPNSFVYFRGPPSALGSRAHPGLIPQFVQNGYNPSTGILDSYSPEGIVGYVNPFR